MYQHIKQDIKAYNLPQTSKDLLAQLQKAFKLKEAFTIQEFENAFVCRMYEQCDFQAKRVHLSILYQLFFCHHYNTPISIFEIVVIQNDFKRLNEMLLGVGKQQALELVNRRFNKYPLMYYSARSGHIEPMRILVRFGCKFDFQKDQSTPVHAAAFYGFPEIVQYLIDLGVPVDIRNKTFKNLPIEECNSQEIVNMLLDAYGNKIDQLNFRLTNQGKSNGKIRIYYKGELVGQKIILNNYEYKSFNRIKTFHGTKFQVLESIVKNGMKMPGDLIQGRRLQVLKNHIQEQAKVFGIQNFAKGIFSSPSILYAGCPVYAKTFQVEINGEKQHWDPILQLRVKKEFYDEFESTVNQKFKAMGQPDKIQVRVGYDQRQKFYQQVEKGVIKTLSKDPAEVQALIFVKSGFLMRNIKKEGIVQQMNRLFMESEEQKHILLKYEIK